MRLHCGWVLGFACSFMILLAPTPGRAGGFGPHPARPTSGFGHVDRSGMNEHVIRGIYQGLISGGFIGYAISTDTDERTSTRVATGAILGGVAGAVLPLTLNRGDKEVRTGDVIFINVAQNWGLFHGGLLPAVFQLGRFDSNEEVEFSRNEIRLDLGLAAVTSLTAGGLAAWVAPELNFSPGQAASIGASGIWGGLAGTLLISIIGPDDFTPRWSQASIVTSLALADAAMLSTWAGRDHFDVDRSRVTLMNIGGLVGMAVGIAGAYFIDPGLENHRVIAASLLVGAGLGLGTGYYLSDGWDEYKKSVPPLHGSGLSLLELRQGRWSGGLPMPRPAVVPDARGTMKVRTVFSLAEGSF